jgi:hypothetical protein
MELWFESVRANCDPAETGLAFVVPPSDDATRAAISTLSEGFKWVEVMRDKQMPFDRGERSKKDKHATLAVARNRLLAFANKIQPQRFISWDSDLLLHPGTVEEIERRDVPLGGVWAWLNRRKPSTILHENPQDGSKRRVQWEEPMQATGMRWVGREKAAHYPGDEWLMRGSGFWRADVVLGFQMMQSSVYSTTHYGPHIDGEDIPFNWQLERRHVPRYIYGDAVAVHLYDHDPTEIALGWPNILTLSTQMPLAAGAWEPRDPVDEALGFYPA